MDAGLATAAARRSQVHALMARLFRLAREPHPVAGAVLGRVT